MTLDYAPDVGSSMEPQAGVADRSDTSEALAPRSSSQPRKKPFKGSIFILNDSSWSPTTGLFQRSHSAGLIQVFALLLCLINDRKARMNYLPISMLMCLNMSLRNVGSAGAEMPTLTTYTVAGSRLTKTC